MYRIITVSVMRTDAAEIIQDAEQQPMPTIPAGRAAAHSLAI